MAEQSNDRSVIPTRLPLISLPNVVLFPGVTTQLLVRDATSRTAVEEAALDKGVVLFAMQRDTGAEGPMPADVHPVGVASIVKAISPIPDGSLSVLVQGLSRVRVGEVSQFEGRIFAEIVELPDVETADPEEVALTRNLSRQFQRMIELSPKMTDELAATARSMERRSSRLANLIATGLETDLEEKQRLLELDTVRSRLERLTVLINRELVMVEAGNRIQNQVMEEVGQVQREHFLREQMKIIREELGDDENDEIDELRSQVAKAKLPEEAESQALREIERLKRMAPGASENAMVRTYLDWLINLPWKGSRDRLDIERAKRILDEDHEGLQQVKERMLEYLAVRKLNPDSKGPILCLVGPPGVGKTSLGRSIARAMGRKFARISLGGIHDEAEIRGHRRTYVGSLPGRIIQSLRKVGTNNPVFMLDEIDKVGADYRGDPASALLEVLDPEQNHTFEDHYLNLAFDLSGVTFLATANSLDTIPPALRDRLEVVHLSGYTEEEKVRIVHTYLLPRQQKQHGISRRKVLIAPEATKAIINEYTHEAGVRGLEREVGRICRKIAHQVVEGKRGPFAVDVDGLGQLLGPPRMPCGRFTGGGVPGVVNGLAWTPAGGEVMLVEATKMQGNKKLTLTGQLGEVMRESAQIALSYIRSRAEHWHLDESFFDEQDLHIHLPAGATPKDGPSAGVTVATALVSLLTERPVREDLAMTGEVTLRGAVLPVGGIKEKVLAAHRDGLTTVVLPSRNARDLESLPQEVRDTMTFHPVDDLTQLLAICFDERTVRQAA